VRDAERFVALQDAPRCLRTLLEINEQAIGEAHLPSGAVAESNAALIRAAREMASVVSK
jgi:hypothetical protein